MGNGFKVWHYSGALLQETPWQEGQELLQVLWQKYPDGVFTEKPISKAKVQGIQSSQPQAVKAVYVPPNIRGSAAPIGTSPRPGYQPPHERGPIPGLPVGYKVSQGQKKKERNAKRKDDIVRPNSNVNTSANSNEDTNASQAQNQTLSSSQNNKRNQRRTPRQSNSQIHTNGNNSQANFDLNTTPKPNANNTSPSVPIEQSGGDGAETQNSQEKLKRERRPRNRQRKEDGVSFTGDPEKDKRMRTVHQKLRDIEKLKVRREKGDILEANQLSKIGLEAELVKELNALKVEA